MQAALLAPRDSAAPPHPPLAHSYAVLGFYIGGRARVELNGEWSVGAGDVLLMPAGQAHRSLESRAAECWGVSFRAPCLTTEGAAAMLEPFERVRSGGSGVVRIPVERQTYFTGLFEELERVGREPCGRSGSVEAIQRSLLTLILAEVDRASDTSGTLGAIAGGVAAEALRFIERNCLGPLSVNDVAAAVQRSPTHVTTALTNATGRSAVQWIVSGRMAEARRLLLHSNQRVDAVAERVGYADSTHFIRMFRREHGATPAAWRAARVAERATAPRSR